MRCRFSRATAVAMCSILLALGLVLWGCGGTTAPSAKTSSPDTDTTDILTPALDRVEPSAQAQADVPLLVSGNTAFALDLFTTARVSPEDQGKNLVFSPHGLSVALAMVWAGARGETESQMAETLHLPLPQDALHPTFNALDLELTASADGEGGATLEVANSLWPFALSEDKVIPAYLDLVSRYYGASVIRPPADVEEARQVINAWVKEATEGRVTEVLPPGSLPEEFTAMVLVDALSFSGLWTYAFPPGNTEEGPFTLADGSTVSVPFMNHDMDFGYLEDQSWQAVELPYGPEGSLEWGDYSMVCLLPKMGSLDEALAGLTSDELQSVLEGLSADELVYVTMPRFSFDSRLRLKETCQTLGMIDAFYPGKADFSSMYETGVPSGIWIDDIYQTATISVDEKGTEAAAGSAVVQVSGIGPNKIVLDHPFLFLIQHCPTGAILFLGQVMNPAQ